MNRTRDTNRWRKTVEDSFGGFAGRSMVWDGLAEMIDVLQPFGGINHALLPSGGGMHGRSFSLSHEPDCIDMAVSPRTGYVFKPRLLTFEHFAEDAGESYFLMDLEYLEPTDVYEPSDRGVEDLLYANGRYLNRVFWDEGNLGYDEEGQEIPLPDNARLASRIKGGRVMLVAQQSAYNSLSATYDGRHSSLSHGDLREFVEALTSYGK